MTEDPSLGTQLLKKHYEDKIAELDCLIEFLEDEDRVLNRLPRSGYPYTHSINALKLDRTITIGKLWHINNP